MSIFFRVRRAFSSRRSVTSSAIFNREVRILIVSSPRRARHGLCGRRETAKGRTFRFIYLFICGSGPT